MLFDFLTTVFLFLSGLLPILACVGGFLFLVFLLWLFLSPRGGAIWRMIVRVCRNEFRCNSCSIGKSCKAAGDVAFPCAGYVEK